MKLVMKMEVRQAEPISNELSLIIAFINTSWTLILLSLLFITMISFERLFLWSSDRSPITMNALSSKCFNYYRLFTFAIAPLRK
jgi:hypothetical protein